VGIVVTLLGAAAQVAAQRGSVNPMDSIRRLPGYRPAHDSTVLLSSSRIAARVPALKREWDAYVARSRAAYARVAVYERLAVLVPPPAGVTREGVLRGDHAMVDSWWNALGFGDTSWWRMWQGSWPGSS
jgi:hypothetical protein